MPDDARPQPPQIVPQFTPFNWHCSIVGRQALPNGEQVPLVRVILTHLMGNTVLFGAVPDWHAFIADLQTVLSGGITVATEMPPDPFGPRP